MWMRRRRNSGLMVGTLIGSMIGAAGALLLAPKPGRELREDLMEQARQSGVTARNMRETMMEMGSEWTMELDNGENVPQEEDKTTNSTNKTSDGKGGDIGYVIKEVLEEPDIYNNNKTNKP